MKKITILLICCCLSMSFTFRGCPVVFEIDPVFGGLVSAITGGIILEGDNVSGAFEIAVGTNGTISKSTGSDTINFIPKTSGTTQDLNSIRIQPTGFQPKIIVVGHNGTIVRSTDIGETWILSTPVTAANLYGTDFNNSYYYAVGDNGTILLSVTGGANWTQIPGGTTRNLKAISLNSQFGSNIVAVGEKGTIIRTINSGINWSNVSITDTTIDFYSITQKARSNSSGNYFYIAGSQGKVYKSTDQGATWVLKNSGTTNTLRSVYFVTVDSGAVTGDNGTVKMTTNGGDTWFTDNIFNSVTGNITSISEMPRSQRTFTAVSDNKFYLVSENPPFIGIEKISSGVPKGYSLSQNYPNPFNPSTKIGFELPKSSFAKLIVYDITGREIETLVNEELRTGVYEYEWNAGSFPSGIYFYVLKTEDFTSTRKMILIK